MDNVDVSNEVEVLKRIKAEVSKVVVGQDYMVDRLLVALMCNQHILLEGVPGLAKTLTVNTLAKSLSIDFSRIQFTPDLLPSDLLGTLIFNPKSGDFSTKKGPVFANIVLADEINRAPAKVQSALLECMQEKQVTLGDETFKLDAPFMVLATQNPIDQEGTYPLPEAQVDRFLMKIKVDYPSKEEELEILNSMSKINGSFDVESVVSSKDIQDLTSIVDSVFIDEKLKEYIVDIVRATRDPKSYGLDIDSLISFGASPRAIISLTMASKAYAILQGRSWVLPEDIMAIVYDVLRHRVILSYEAMAEGFSSETLIDKILDKVKIK